MSITPSPSSSSSSDALDPPTLPLADRAWQLFCQGLSYSAIARQLHIDRETVARHIHTIHHDLQADRRADRSLTLSRAIATAHAVQAAAWEALAREEAREDASLSVPATPESASNLDAPSLPRPIYRAHRARLLGIILAAAREAARLELLYDHDAPARAADQDQKDEAARQPKFVIMMRPSDEDELRRLGYDVPSDPSNATNATTSDSPDSPSSSSAPTDLPPADLPPANPADDITAAPPAAPPTPAAHAPDDASAPDGSHSPASGPLTPSPPSLVPPRATPLTPAAARGWRKGYLRHPAVCPMDCYGRPPSAP